MLEPNTLLQDRYQIMHLLRRGGMGAVYEATDHRLKAQVAIKQLLPSSDPALAPLLPRMKRAFEREAQILAGCHHPALPVVSDYFIESDAYFLVMQFIPGMDLAEQLQHQQAPFSVEIVLDWADTLLDALEYLHARQPPIIHRDIKPQNLKLSSHRRIMLLDFGLAKGAPAIQSHVTGDESIIHGGTPNYQPPEQDQGSRTDQRSDLFALGATLYDLLSNTRPVQAGKRVHAFMDGQPDPLRPLHELNPTVPAETSAAMHHAMALRADDRPQSAAEMRKELRATRKTISEAATVPTIRTAARLAPHMATPEPPASPQAIQDSAQPILPSSRSTGALRRPQLYAGIAMLAVLLIAMIWFRSIPGLRSSVNTTPSAITGRMTETVLNIPTVSTSSATIAPTSVPIPTPPSTNPPNAPSSTTSADPATLILHPFSTPQAIQGLAIVDKDIWAATEHGLVHVKPNGMYDTFTKRDGLPFDLCTAIIAAPDGTLWVGEHDIVNIRPTGNTWVLVSSHNRSEGGDIGLLHTVYSDSDSSIWAGGAYGAKHVSGVSKTPDPPVNDPNLKGEVYTFLRSSDGALWIGFADGVRRWDGKNWQTFGAQAGITIALDLAQDSNGTIWAATGLDGLKYFDGERWQPKPVLGATHDITTIAFIGGYLWVSGGGIIARTSDGGTNWQNLDQNGLAMGNVISSLVPDAENRVWIHSYNGIHYYKPER